MPVNNSAIEIINLSKTYKEKGGKLVEVYKDFNLLIPKGKIVAILGPNGCGKSTLIDIILGLNQPDSGSVNVFSEGGSKKTHKKIGVIFQELGLFPWLSVIENLLFGVKDKNFKSKKIAESYLKRYDLEKFSNSQVSSLSGGMQQKLAIARVLITEPDIFILDEPFSALDPISKNKMVKEIKKINNVSKKTILFVTHNIQDAVDLGDMIIVLNSKPVNRATILINKQGKQEEVAAQIRKAFTVK